MSIEVPLGELSDFVSRRTFAYLVTVDEDCRPRLLAVDVAIRDEHLSMDGGRSATRNVPLHPDVCLAFPPVAESPVAPHSHDHDRYTLLVDGRASIDGDGRIVVVPTWAVLHRPAPPFSG